MEALELLTAGVTITWTDWNEMPAMLRDDILLLRSDWHPSTAEGG